MMGLECNSGRHWQGTHQPPQQFNGEAMAFCIAGLQSAFQEFLCVLERTLEAEEKRLAEERSRVSAQIRETEAWSTCVAEQFQSWAAATDRIEGLCTSLDSHRQGLSDERTGMAQERQGLEEAALYAHTVVAEAQKPLRVQEAASVVSEAVTSGVRTEQYRPSSSVLTPKNESPETDMCLASSYDAFATSAPFAVIPADFLQDDCFTPRLANEGHITNGLPRRAIREVRPNIRGSASPQMVQKQDTEVPVQAPSSPLVSTRTTSTAPASSGSTGVAGGAYSDPKLHSQAPEVGRAATPRVCASSCGIPGRHSPRGGIVPPCHLDDPDLTGLEVQPKVVNAGQRQESATTSGRRFVDGQEVHPKVVQPKVAFETIHNGPQCCKICRRIACSCRGGPLLDTLNTPDLNRLGVQVFARHPSELCEDAGAVPVLHEDL